MSVKDYLPDFFSENIEFDPANQHCTFRQTREKDATVTEFTVIGFIDPIFALKERYPRGSQHEKYGTLTDLVISQSEGPHWLATFTYRKEKADDDTESGAGTLTGPKSSQLTVRMMSIPIEAARNYRYIWNNNLYVDRNWYTFRKKWLPNAHWTTDGGTVLNIDELLTYLINYDGMIYKDHGVKYHLDMITQLGLGDFIKWSTSEPGQLQNMVWSKADAKQGSNVEEARSISDAGYIYVKQLDPKVLENLKKGDFPSDVKWYTSADLNPIDTWHVAHKMIKPGVSSFDYPVYEMTETSKHVGKKAAGWAIAEIAGRISEPKYGDFGIVDQLGGDWLCLGGTVSYNGDFWQATRTYQHSPDGWDNDIYREGQRDKQ